LNKLPEPDAHALAHSQQLTDQIRDEIAANGGFIPFSRFMERALYAPGLGYYSAGAHKFGKAGDFITAPETGSLFAASIANALAPGLQQIGQNARFLELGGGSGAFAKTVLEQLQKLSALPEIYAILEPSADLRQRQHDYLKQHLSPSLFARLHWLDRPFDDAWEGILFANEVIDALPCTRFNIQNNQVYEQIVKINDQRQFITAYQPADALLNRAVRHIEHYLETRFADGYSSEVLVQLPYWMQAVSAGLRRGMLLFIDYGYPRHEYYHVERDQGTVRAFYRHHVHNEVYRWPGLQDITASVDFTALAEAGTSAGFALAGYCSQANFLLANGIIELLEHAQTHADESQCLSLRNEFKQLTLPTEMGAYFQVMGFVRDVESSSAFSLGDLSWRL